MATAAAAVTLAGLAGLGGCATPARRAAAPGASTAGAGSTPTTVAEPPPDLAATSSVLGPWHLVGHQSVFAPMADEGLATVGGQVVYRGDLDVTPADVAAGWDHIGDPGSDGTDLVDAFQGPPGATAKMFQVTTPGGATRRYVHPLDPGELANNSFAAISPDGRWLVSGEWFDESRLLVFPSPTEAAGPGAPAPGQPLPLAATIQLDRPALDIQGCAFATATRLLCVSDDPGTTRWPTPFPLLQVDLERPLDGSDVDARVTDLGGLPTVSRCPGAFEPEGIDVDRATGTLRVEVLPPAPCSVGVTVYDYHRVSGRGGRRAPGPAVASSR